MGVASILLVFAFVLAALAAANIGHPRVHLGWAAFACYVLAGLLGSHGIR